MSGTEGYEEEAASLFARYDSKPFAEVQGHLLDLLPPPPGRVVDIGAGTGRDAAGFAALGYEVLAVEPTAAFRTRASAAHASPRITWLDDHLPELTQVIARRETFDVVMMTAVWMHLDPDQQRVAMAAVAGLLAAPGILALTLRHGPVPPGRRMFDVPAEAVIALAERHALRCVRRLDDQPGHLGQPGVSWTRLVLARNPADAVGVP